MRRVLWSVLYVVAAWILGNLLAFALAVFLRYLWAAICFVAALLFAGISWGPLHNLFEDHTDSPDVVYLILGFPFLALSASFLVAAVLLIRPRQR